MAYRVLTALVTAKDQHGRIYYYYDNVNPIIPWLSEQQREQFLADGMVEDIGEPDATEVAITYPTARPQSAPALDRPDHSQPLGGGYRTFPAGIPAPEPDVEPYRTHWRHGTAAALYEQAAEQDRAVGDGQPAVADCIAALDRLAVPTTSGAPTAREALRSDGQRFGNDVIAAAVRERKSSPAALSGTAPSGTE